ncbi:MAG TPA: DUF3536 domain-containing protein [Thermomicrobiaceae bacterium]|nr:DUF3536 domain-containing protein [Thermomicrobiaceae bacterium]
MARYLCVHGHFYQPPREDPETGLVPREPGADPFHDYNEKILHECYGPNAEHGNFAWANFDVGPTLGLWIARHHPEVLARIAAGDREARARTGHGNAIVQSFHHTILPLASARDRRTELRWGIRWFEHVFGRRPLGIWLPETAVDQATLEACADEGLRFTILSPEQAAEPVDMRFPYRVALPSGREFAVVFYEGPLSGTVSFDPFSTNSAPDFVRSFLEPRFAAPLESGEADPIVLIASDGEVYGHHHRFKDYFLQDLLQVRAAEAGMTPVSLEAFLASQPPVRIVTIREQSSWGCPHALLRWRGDCDCTPGDGHWKGELRAAFDDLAAELDAVTEALAPATAGDVWALRDDYVDVAIGAKTLPEWLAGRGLPAEGRDAAAIDTLMRAQQSRLAMYASCAFYWDDLSRIEAAYGVRSGLHAARLVDRAFGTGLARHFSDRLGGVIGWKTARSAADLYVAAS